MATSNKNQVRDVSYKTFRMKSPLQVAADDLKASLESGDRNQAPEGTGPLPWQCIIDQHALAFQLSLHTRDFSFFNALRAQDVSSGATPALTLLNLNLERGQAVLDKLLSQSQTTIKTISDSFH